MPEPQNHVSAEDAAHGRHAEVHPPFQVFQLLYHNVQILFFLIKRRRAPALRPSGAKRLFAPLEPVFITL